MTDRVVYDEHAGTWWDEDGFLHGMGTLLNPVRVPYVAGVLGAVRGGAGCRVLDIGCGGGLLAEPLADAGMVVTGIDASLPSLAAGRVRRTGVGYVGGLAERLPFSEGVFDAVAAMEVLEHVADPATVVAEAARVLRPGGVFFFGGPSRTRVSRLALIDVAQRWRWSAVLPVNLHVWDRFIKPGEMSSMLAGAGVDHRDTVGLGLKWSALIPTVRAYRGLRRGNISHAEAGRRVPLTTRRSTAIAYIGYGIKRPAAGLGNSRPGAAIDSGDA